MHQRCHRHGHSERHRIGCINQRILTSNLLNYVNSGYHSKTLFHRVIPGFVVFGKVTSDLAVVDGIAACLPALWVVPLTDVVIQLVVQTK